MTAPFSFKRARPKKWRTLLLSIILLLFVVSLGWFYELSQISRFQKDNPWPLVPWLTIWTSDHDDKAGRASQAKSSHMETAPNEAAPLEDHSLSPARNSSSNQPFISIAGSAGQGPLVVATADLSRIFDAYDRTKELGEQLDKMDQQDHAKHLEQMKIFHQQLVDEIVVAIRTYSQSHGIDVVFDTSPSSANGLPILLYENSKVIDLTDTVIAELNAKRTTDAVVKSDESSPIKSSP